MKLWKWIWNVFTEPGSSLAVSKKKRGKKKESLGGFLVSYRGADLAWRVRIASFNRAPSAEKNPLSPPGSSASAQPDPMYFNLPLSTPWCLSKSKAKKPNQTCCSLQSRGTSFVGRLGGEILEFEFQFVSLSGFHTRKAHELGYKFWNFSFGRASPKIVFLVKLKQVKLKD